MNRLAHKKYLAKKWGDFKNYKIIYAMASVGVLQLLFAFSIKIILSRQYIKKRQSNSYLSL